MNDDEQLLHDVREYESWRVASYREPSIPLRDVLEAASVAEVTLRNWLTRGRLALDADKDRTPGNHRLFSRRDAVLIALLSAMSNAGLSVTESAPIAEKFVMGIIGNFATKIMGLGGEPVFYLWKDKGEWTARMVLETKVRDIGIELVPPVAIIIHPISILETVFQTLSDRGI